MHDNAAVLISLPQEIAVSKHANVIVTGDMNLRAPSYIVTYCVSLRQ